MASEMGASPDGDSDMNAHDTKVVSLIPALYNERDAGAEPYASNRDGLLRSGLRPGRFRRRRLSGALRVLPRRQSASENRRVEYLERTELGRDGVDREPTQPRGA